MKNIWILILALCPLIVNASTSDQNSQPAANAQALESKEAVASASDQETPSLEEKVVVEKCKKKK